MHNFDPILDRLGKEHDSVLAKEIGCNRATITKLRLSLGLPKCDPMAAGRHLLGRIPDAELARRLGVAPSTVHAARKKAGIPTYSKSGAAAHARLRKYVEAMTREVTP